MSIDSDPPGKPTTRPAVEEAFAPLPVWNESAQEPEVRAPASKVPPRSRLPQRQATPQTETIFKALGAVLIISALVVAAVLAIPNGGGESPPTATSGVAVVMAPDNVSPPQLAATPSDDLAFDAQNAKVTICIDAGHGGEDLGFQRAATSSAPAMNESYFSLAIAKELERRLTARGFKVIMTRTDDQEVNFDDFDANNDGQTEMGGSSTEEAVVVGVLDEMQSRIDRCNDERADVMVSIHVDGSADPAVRGSRVWYAADRPFAQENQALSALVYEELENQMRLVGYPWIGQGIVEIADAANAGEHAQQQQLLLGGEVPELKEPSAMPGVVAEVLTISSDADATFLASEPGVSTIALALDQAIVRFVETTLRGAG